MSIKQLLGINVLTKSSCFLFRKESINNDLLHSTREYKGSGKQNYYHNEYIDEGDRVVKYKCHEFRAFDGKENTWHRDIGQMNMYMGYFAEEINEPDDNPPIGLILAREKDELMVKYATYGMDTNLFVSKYELYLPDEAELRKLVEGALEEE